MASLHFKGKAFVQNYHLTVPYHELIPVKKKSVTAEVSLHDNLIVQGDNLKALKALLPTYAGKVKCIYIDPPYNTGNEHWRYNDSVNSPMMQEWFEKEVTADDLTRHDKWLCMLMPRLKLLRELLHEDGVLFVSIDDNESHRLRCILDEVFGEECFLGEVCWKTRNTDNRVKTYISRDQEYVFVYARKPGGSLRGRIIDRTAFQNADNDKRGPYVTDPLTGKATRKERPNLHFKIINEKTGDVYDPDPSRGWITDSDGIESLKAQEKIWWPPNPKTGKPRKKRFLFETAERMPVSTFWSDLKGQSGADELDQIMGSRKFSFPKSLEVVSRILDYSADKNAIILDSFAGSGTTAHAVLALNKADGGNRKFILVECEDYADSLTAERVRRVIKGVPKASDEALKKGLGGTFSYFELGQAVDVTRLFDRKKLPAYAELAKYVFFTATGREFDAKKLDEKRWFIGETGEHEVYLLYKPDLAWLKGAALTLEAAQALPKPKGKRRMFFAPTKYLDQDHLDLFKIDFAQLPFEIYRMQG
ncbi:MAG: site-specific DNA-methyltransferase [Planctomycetes bacterium]|nr:site-specific DNA-methyltransferase [Planctomycetota bacterium]